MGNTAQAGLPWPEPTAPVRDGAAAMRALAEALDPRVPLKVFAGSGGYTTNSGGGLALTVPFQTVTFGLAWTEINAYGYGWYRASTGPPPATVWFNFVDLAARAYVPNIFAIINYIVMGF